MLIDVLWVCILFCETKQAYESWQTEQVSAYKGDSYFYTSLYLRELIHDW